MSFDVQGSFHLINKDLHKLFNVYVKESIIESWSLFLILIVS